MCRPVRASAQPDALQNQPTLIVQHIVREDGIVYKFPAIEIQTLQAYWITVQVSNFPLHGQNGVRRCNFDMYRPVSGSVDGDVQIHPHRAEQRYHGAARDEEDSSASPQPEAHQHQRTLVVQHIVREDGIIYKFPASEIQTLHAYWISV
jgi:hypothetical protein